MIDALNYAAFLHVSDADAVYSAGYGIAYL